MGPLFRKRGGTQWRRRSRRTLWGDLRSGTGLKYSGNNRESIDRNIKVDKRRRFTEQSLRWCVLEVPWVFSPLKRVPQKGPDERRVMCSSLPPLWTGDLSFPSVSVPWVEVPSSSRVEAGLGEFETVNILPPFTLERRWTLCRFLTLFPEDPPRGHRSASDDVTKSSRHVLR